MVRFSGEGGCWGSPGHRCHSMACHLVARGRKKKGCHRVSFKVFPLRTRRPPAWPLPHNIPLPLNSLNLWTKPFICGPWWGRMLQSRTIAVISLALPTVMRKRAGGREGLKVKRVERRGGRGAVSKTQPSDSLLGHDTCFMLSWLAPTCPELLYPSLHCTSSVL